MNCEPFDIAVVNKTLGSPVIEKYLLGKVVQVGASFWIDRMGGEQWDLTEPMRITGAPCNCGAPTCSGRKTLLLESLPDMILKPLRDKPGEDEAQRIARDKQGRRMMSALRSHPDPAEKLVLADWRLGFVKGIR